MKIHKEHHPPRNRGAEWLDKTKQVDVYWDVVLENWNKYGLEHLKIWKIHQFRSRFTTQ